MVLSQVNSSGCERGASRILVKRIRYGCPLEIAVCVLTKRFRQILPRKPRRPVHSPPHFNRPQSLLWEDLSQSIPRPNDGLAQFRNFSDQARGMEFCNEPVNHLSIDVSGRDLTFACPPRKSRQTIRHPTVLCLAQ